MKEAETRTYIIPLRKEWSKVPRWRRTKRAVAALRAFLARHTKTNNIKIGKWLNEELWRRGGKNPPSRISVTVKKEKDVVHAELTRLPQRAKRAQEEAKVRAQKRKQAAESKKEKKVEEKAKIEEHKKKKIEEKRAIQRAKAKVTKKEELEIHK